MNKHIILELKEVKNSNKLSNNCNLQVYIIDENNVKIAEKTITLTASNDVIDSYKLWTYNLNSFFHYNRNEKRSFANQKTRENLVSKPNKTYNQCNESKNYLLKKINQTLSNNELKNWLNAQVADSDKSSTIIIKTNDLKLGSIPWEHCDIFDSFYKKNNLKFGLFFSTGNLITNQTLEHQNEITNILVILGDDSNIDLGFDKQEFQNLKESFRKLENRANVEIKIIKPNLAELKKTLKEENWNIIYYGGHSETIEDEQDGVFCLGDDKEVKTPVRD